MEFGNWFSNFHIHVENLLNKPYALFLSMIGVHRLMNMMRVGEFPYIDLANLERREKRWKMTWKKRENNANTILG